MSRYENYSRTAESYDATRVAVGTEILLGCLASGATPIERAVVLDAGCGTGSYAAALIEHVAHIDAVDLNARMLERATAKLAAHARTGRVAFHQAGIERLPFEEGRFTAAMINQVLHHVPDAPEEGYPGLRAVFGELARVMRAGAVLTISTCSHEQLRRSWWYYALIPRALDRCIALHIPLEVLRALLAECGFEVRSLLVPLDAVIQGEQYANPRGPLDETWRDGDSIWALAAEDELRGALARIEELDRRGELRAFVHRHDEWRRHLGQVTFVHAVRA